MKLANRLSVLSIIGMALLVTVIASASAALFMLSASTDESLKHAEQLDIIAEARRRFFALETSLTDRLEQGGTRKADRTVERGLEELGVFLESLPRDPRRSSYRLGEDLRYFHRALDGAGSSSVLERDGTRIAMLREKIADLSDMQARQRLVLRETLERGHHARNIAYSIFGLAVVTAVTGIFFVVRQYSRWIVKPIVRIGRVAGRLGEGDLSAECPDEGPLELKRLAGSMNQLARSLKHKIRELEGAVVKEQMVVRQLAVLNDIASLFFNELDLDQILNIIVKSGRDLVKAEYSLVFLVNQDGKVAQMRAMGMEETVLSSFEEPKGLLRFVMHERMPLRLVAPFDHPAAVGMPEGHPEMRNLLAVPILAEGRPIGEFVLGNRIGADEFSEEDEDQVLHFSFLAAVGIEKAMLHQEVVRLAQTDGLTGLINHRTFQERLAEEISRGIRFERQATLLLIDIDHFKRFNDTYGHQAGDEMLKALAGVFRGNIRGIDCAARYGGEEFAIILSETGYEGGRKTASRILHEVRNAGSRVLGSQSHASAFPLTVSVGMSVYPEDGQTRETLIRMADESLYRAKADGRNRLVTYRELSKMPPT